MILYVSVCTRSLWSVASPFFRGAEMWVLLAWRIPKGAIFQPASCIQVFQEFVPVLDSDLWSRCQMSFFTERCAIVNGMIYFKDFQGGFSAAFSLLVIIISSGAICTCGVTGAWWWFWQVVVANTFLPLLLPHAQQARQLEVQTGTTSISLMISHVTCGLWKH